MEIESLGTIVSWEAPKEVKFSDLQCAVMDAGFDLKYAREMLPRNAFSRAARDLSEARVIRKVEEDDTEIRFQFTKEYLFNNAFQYDRECDMWVNKDTGSVRSDSPELGAEAHRLLVEHQGKRNQSDVTRIIQNVFEDRKGDLVSLRKNGGVYFVPDSHADLVDAIQKLLNRIGGSLSRFQIRFGDTKTTTSVAQALSDHLHDLIDQFRDSCSGINFDNQSVIERRQVKIMDLRDKLDGYKALLSGYSDSISTEIDRAELDLAQQLLAARPELATTV